MSAAETHSGGRHVEEGEGAHAGTRGGTAGVGRRRVTHLVDQPGARVEPADFVDEQVGAPGGLVERVAGP
jgi:hypothetical protein